MHTALLAFTLAAPALKDRSEPSPLVGEWVVEELTIQGVLVDLKGVYIHYRFTADGRWTTWHRGNPVPDLMTFEMDMKSKPSSIDLRCSERAGRTVSPGIFDVVDDRLMLYTVGEGGKRPKSFETKPGLPGMLTVLKRLSKE